MRILLVEDDKELCDTTAMQLQLAGYETDCCYRGDDGFYYGTEYPYDVMILDRMLPITDGLSLLKSLRQKGIMTPVIITTALDGLRDRIDGLDSGADDYLVKPFAVEELLARIRAVTRRPGRIDAANELTFLNLNLDIDKHLLFVTGKESSGITLSKKEAALMEYFLRNSNQTLPRNLILSYIWGPDSEVEDGNLDNYIYFLRRRLKALGGSVKIQTVHGVGYRLEENT
jgi:DNA-binding response OmpR family regulator